MLSSPTRSPRFFNRSAALRRVESGLGAAPNATSPQL